MRWLVFLLLLSSPAFGISETDFGDFTANATEVTSGSSVLLTADWLGASGFLEIKSVDGERVAIKSCSGSCTPLEGSADVDSTTSFYAEFSDGSSVVNLSESEWITVRVLDNVGPENVRFEFPATASISVSLTAIVEFRDSSGIESISIDFGDGLDSSLKSFNCGSDDVCETTFSYTYEDVGSYTVKATATDVEGASTPEEHTINIDSSLDRDADGVLNSVDVCPETRDSLTDFVASSGDYMGCSCTEVEEDDLGADDDACTRVSCSLVGGELTITNEPILDGEDPEGYTDSSSVDYSCVDGKVVEEYFASCEQKVKTACWDGDSYFYDSCGNRGSVAESCSGVCVDSEDGSFCASGEACMASPGCRYNEPNNAESTGDTCDVGETCWSCLDGYSYRDGSCRPDLDCEVFYQNDNDGDGQGAGPASCQSGQFANPVTNGLDCNDNNENAFVGNIEICDGIDNDCDGKIDDNCVGEAYPECQKDPLIEFDWQSDTECREERFQITTSYTPTSPACDYVANDPTETGLGEYRNKPDGTSCSSGACQSGSCVPLCEHQCLSEKPANSIEVTAQSCSGTNSCFKCANNMIWDGNKCVNTGYQIVNVGSMTVQDQKTYTLDPVLQTDEGVKKSAVFTYKGLINVKKSSPITLLADGIGTKTLTITAARLQGTQEIQAATTTIEITTVCSSESQCCIEGTTNFQPDGTACGAGICEGGECQIACTPSFENSPRTCSDGIDNSCNGIIDCQTIDGEVNEGCRPFCEAFCPQGQAACGNTCYDLQTSNVNCGTCGNSCSSSEICQAGQCIDQGEQCFVGCNNDDDCEGTCQLAGTCEAFCEDTGVLIVEEEDQTQTLSDIIRQGGFVINKTIIGEELTITATNLVGGTLSNFTMLISFPQEFQFTRSNYPYEQLNERTIRVRTNLEGRQRFEYDLTATGDPERIVIEPTHDPVDPTEIKRLTNDELTIRSNFEETEDATKISLTLTPGSNLKDLRVPLEIPKCLAEHVDEIQFDQSNYEVINVDPLMVWTFDALNAEQEISFTVPKIVDQNCKDQMRAFGVADSEPINPWLPIAIIPIIGLTLVFFQRFHKDTEHLNKKEFYKLAKEQGQSEGDIERSWAEYKRRF